MVGWVGAPQAQLGTAYHTRWLYYARWLTVPPSVPLRLQVLSQRGINLAKYPFRVYLTPPGACNFVGKLHLWWGRTHEVRSIAGSSMNSRLQSAEHPPPWPAHSATRHFVLNTAGLSFLGCDYALGCRAWIGSWPDHQAIVHEIVSWREWGWAGRLLRGGPVLSPG